MGVEAYHSERRISFDHRNPSVRYGYYVSLSVTAWEAYPFESEAGRAAYEAAASKVLESAVPERAERELVAAVYLVSERAHDEQIRRDAACWLREFGPERGYEALLVEEEEPAIDIGGFERKDAYPDPVPPEALHLSALEARLLRQLAHDADFMACGDLAKAESSQPKLREFLKGVLARAEDRDSDGPPIALTTRLGCLPTGEERADLVERMLGATPYGEMTRPFQVESVLADIRAYCEVCGVDYEKANRAAARAHEGLGRVGLPRSPVGRSKATGREGKTR